MSIILTIIIFGIVVIIHELGHFLAARKNGILVEEFSIGMGPLLYQIKGSETLYSIRLLPVGGYCKMLGEDADCNDERSFGSKTVWQRFQVLVAGVLLNIILGFLIFFVIVGFNGYTEPVVGTLLDGYPAQTSGLQSGDKIIKVDNKKIHTYFDYAQAMSNADANNVKLVALRDGKKLEFNTSLKYDSQNQKYLLGFSPVSKAGMFTIKPVTQTASDGISKITLEKAGFFGSIYNTFWFIIFYFTLTMSSLAKLFTGALSINQLSGPIGIVTMVGTQYKEVAADGIWVIIESMLNIMGNISLALGFFNILPFPALDGGRIVFLGIEAVRGKPISPEKEGIVHFVGFVLIAILAILVAYNDIIKIFHHTT